MTWYEEATNAIVAKINATVEEDGNMPDPDEITAIIAAHDPNRWVPVSERLPLLISSIEFIHNGELYTGTRWAPCMWIADTDDSFSSGVTHWRPIVLPEVKHGE